MPQPLLDRIAGAALVLLLAGPSSVARAQPKLDCPAGSEIRYSKQRQMAWCEDEARKRQGPFESHFKDGSLRAQGRYHKGQKHGWWRLWIAPGELKEASEYRAGEVSARRRLGASDELARASRSGDLVHPCPADSVVGGNMSPHPRRQWCERQREDGAFERHGPMVEIWPDGQRRLAQQYDHGILLGVSRKWHRNGIQASETVFESGVKQSSMAWHKNGFPKGAQGFDADGNLNSRTTFYSTGERKTETEYLSGRRHGGEFSWWPNGQLRWQGQHRDHRKDGTWRNWSPDGRLASIQEFEEHATGGQSISPRIPIRLRPGRRPPSRAATFARRSPGSPAQRARALGRRPSGWVSASS